MLEPLLDSGENAVGRGVKSCLHPSVAKPATHEFALEFLEENFPAKNEPININNITIPQNERTRSALTQ